MKEYQKIYEDQMGWGALFMPARKKQSSGAGLRTVVFTSTNAADLLLDSLTRYEMRFPDLLNIRGIATDDPNDPRTKISVNKRIWQFYTPDERETMMQDVIRISMDHGISCYTGNVKTDYFRQLLAEWDPEVIIMCCFGQKVDKFIYQYPRLGMYNFHPSDLAARIGAGAQPFQSSIKEGNTTSVMTVHQVTEIIDVGPIVGSSPRVNIKKEDGSFPNDIRNLQVKIPSVCGWMGIILIRAIESHRKKGNAGPVSKIDFATHMEESTAAILLQPVQDDTSLYELPKHPLIR
jgi:folate-dependent phosphoribosylglycinamide formyltransferase PurN